MHAYTISVIQIRYRCFFIFSKKLFQELSTLKVYFYSYFHYVLSLVQFLNRKEKTFSIQDHSHFYRTLTATSFSDERFNLNRVRSLRKRRNTKSKINGRFLRRRPKFLASILCTNGIITGKYKYLYQNIRLKKQNGQKIIGSFGLALG